MRFWGSPVVVFKEPNRGFRLKLLLRGLSEVFWSPTGDKSIYEMASSENEDGKEFPWRYHCAQSDYTDLNLAEAEDATIRRVIIHGQPARLDRLAGRRLAAAWFAARACKRC